ncbi:hypothetical protein EK599_02310 [Vibrio sp. T187]|uniref:ABC transporter substrate-binding protein n=1 Tax=Vibrio TaxID=662 RepID=UPI0010C9DEC6|nr:MULTISPECIES: ABC transporter substrate-binding protein [Vibrio]MBW3694512.1 hypothetical protein [Vibrio sp. T187]
MDINLQLTKFASWQERIKPIFTSLILVLTSLFSFSTVASDKSPYKIGLALWTGYPTSLEGFKDGLKAGGVDINKDVIFVEGEISSDKDKQRAAAEQFKSENVDLVYSLTTPGTVIVKETLPNTTPIVFSIVTYPADSGLIESFEYSGNNLVGTSNYIPLEHYVSLIQELVPNTKTAAIFHRKGEPNSNIQASNLIRLLRRQGIQVTDVTATSVEDLTKQATALKGKVDLFITTTDTLLQTGGERALIEVSNQLSIPILSSNKLGIQQGSTFGPVADFYTLGKMSGQRAAQILLEDIEPRFLESALQPQPIFLINKKSANQLNISVTGNQDSYQWYE